MLSVIGFIEMENWSFAHDWEDRKGGDSVVPRRAGRRYESIGLEECQGRRAAELDGKGVFNYQRWYWILRLYNIRRENPWKV